MDSFRIAKKRNEYVVSTGDAVQIGRSLFSGQLGRGATPDDALVDAIKALDGAINVFRVVTLDLEFERRKR